MTETVMPWTDEWIEAIAAFNQLLDDAGATNDATHAVHLRPVISSTDLDLLQQATRELVAGGFEVAGRGAADGGARLFAYEQSKRAGNERFGSFLWLSVHSSLASWWLISAWRTKQLALAAHDLLATGQLVAASACSRSLVETAAVIRQDVTEASQRWEACKQFAPSIPYPLPSSVYKPLHDYLLEMLFGGKFKEEIPDGIAALISEPPPRKSIQTPIDRLAKVDSPIARTYDVLCNTVHPSIGGTFSYVAGITRTGPGEVQVEFRQLSSRSSPDGEEDFLVAAIRSGIVRGLHWITKALDDGLRLCDDIALTTRACQVLREPYWRAVVAPNRNSPCICRSGKKSKKCRHEWGTGEYVEPSDDGEPL